MTRRRPAFAVRARLTVSYAGFLVAAGAVASVVAWLLLWRFVPTGNVVLLGPGGTQSFVPDRDDLLAVLAPAAAVVLLGLAVVGLAGGWWLAGRMLRPLATITEGARLVAAGSLTHRIRLSGPDDEFRELADVFDAMLARIEQHVDEQRRFAANASHELRTPLAVTRTMLEVARSSPDAVDVERLLARLDHTNDRAIALVEAMLDLARAAQVPLDVRPVDLAGLAQATVDLVVGGGPGADAGADAAPAVALDLAPADAIGNDALLGRAVENLVRNAVVHGEPGGGMRVATRATPTDAELEVSNPGAPLDPAHVQDLAEPFHRGAGRSRADGQGLGLAIADSIATAHGGELRLAARQGGGLVATLRLPRAQVLRYRKHSAEPGPY